MKKKIWIVSEIFWPSETSTGLILTKISEWLSENYEVEVVTTLDSRLEITQIDSFKYGKINFILRNNGKKNIYSYLEKLIFTFKAIIFVKKKAESRDLLFISSNPPFLVLFLPLFVNIKSIYLFHDIFPDNVLGKIRILPYSIKKILIGIANLSYKKIEHGISIGDDMSNVLSQKGVQNIKKITNWAEDNISLIGLPNTSSIKVLYAGNVGHFQGIKKVIDWHKKTKGRVHLIIQGNGKAKKELERYCEMENVQNVEFRDAYTRKEQSLIFSDVHFGIVSLEDFMFGLGVPSKFYNLIKSGLPVLYFGPKYTEVYNEVKYNMLGLIADEINTDIEKHLLTFLGDHNPENSSKYSELKYSEDIIKATYLKYFDEIF